MLALYRRHTTTGYGTTKTEPCPHKSDRLYRRCACPIWISGADPRGKPLRESLKTASWTVAENLKRQKELGEQDRPRVEINAALDAWLAALRAAKRKERTVAQVHPILSTAIPLGPRRLG